MYELAEGKIRNVKQTLNLIWRVITKTSRARTRDVISAFDVSRELEEKVILEKQSLQIKKKPQNLKCKLKADLKIRVKSILSNYMGTRRYIWFELQVLYLL